jgi:hypothetical protein
VPRPHHHFALAAILFGLALAGAACDTAATQYIDPEVVPWEPIGPGITVPEGELLLDMGYYGDDLYAPFEDEGSELVVVNGVQGGEWIMPAVRMLGGEPKATIRCSVTTETGEIVGASYTTVKLFPAVDGWLEIKFYPVRIKRDEEHVLEGLEPIFGLDATLEIEIIDDAERVGLLTYSVVLVGE